MNHMELVYYRLYVGARRITVTDPVTGVYVYLCKGENDADDLLVHLISYFGQFARIEVTRLCDEV